MHESVAIKGKQVNAGQMRTRMLDCLASSCDLPRVIRQNIGGEFCGNFMVILEHERGMQLRHIEPYKPN